MSKTPLAKSLIITLCLTFSICSCAQQSPKPRKQTITPQPQPKLQQPQSLSQALQIIKTRADSAIPLKANGSAIISYHVPNSNKIEKHNLPIELRFNPPSQLYIQGSLAVNPKAVIIGANEREFWMAMHPKEISSYYSGKWDTPNSSTSLTASPQIILESIGLIEQTKNPSEYIWTTSTTGPYQILTQTRPDKTIQKRINIYLPAFQVQTIEYFDSNGKNLATAQLKNYKILTANFQVPTKISITSKNPDGQDDYINISLNSISAATFTEKQTQLLFNPPPIAKFEHIYQYENGNWTEQQ